MTATATDLALLDSLTDEALTGILREALRDPAERRALLAAANSRPADRAGNAPANPHQLSDYAGPNYEVIVVFRKDGTVAVTHEETGLWLDVEGCWVTSATAEDQLLWKNRRLAVAAAVSTL